MRAFNTPSGPCFAAGALELRGRPGPVCISAVAPGDVVRTPDGWAEARRGPYGKDEAASPGAFRNDRCSERR